VLPHSREIAVLTLEKIKTNTIKILALHQNGQGPEEKGQWTGRRWRFAA